MVHVSQGWLLLSYLLHSYTGLPHKRVSISTTRPFPQHISGFVPERGFHSGSDPGEGGNPLTRGAAGGTTSAPAPGCTCYPPVEVTGCRTSTSSHRGPCSFSGSKRHPLYTRPPARRLLSWIRPSTNAKRFPSASHLAPILRHRWRGRPRAP